MLSRNVIKDGLVSLDPLLRNVCGWGLAVWWEQATKQAVGSMVVACVQ